MVKKRTAKKRTVTALSPYLTVRGGASAIEFYKHVFGAKEVARTELAGTDLVEHAELKICRTRVFLCDEHIAAGILSPLSLGGSATLLHLDVSDAEKVWNTAIDAGAVAVSPLDTVPWGGVCGKLVDPFGHYWSIAGEMTELKGLDIEKAADVELGMEVTVGATTDGVTEN